MTSHDADKRKADAAADGAGDLASSAVSRLFGRGSVYTLGTVLEAGSAFLVLPAVTRALVPAEYGVVAAALIVAAIVTFMVALGMPSAVARAFFFKDGPGAARTIVVWTLLVAAVVTAPILASAQLWTRAVTGVDFDATIAFGLLIAIPASVALAAQSFLAAADRPVPFIAVSVVGTGGGQLAGLMLLVLTDTGGAGYVAGLFAGRSAAACVGFALVLRHETHVARKAGAARRALTAALQLGLPTVPHSVANYLLVGGNRLVVASVDGPAAAGRYQLAYVVGTLTVVLVSSVNQAWGPIIYAAADEDRWSILRTTTAALHRLGALLCASIAVGCPVLLTLAAPASYGQEGLIPATAIVSLSVIPMISYLAGHHVLFQVARTGALAWITPLTTVASLALNLALVPILGFPGASLTTVASYVMLAALVRRRTGRHVSGVWDVGTEARAWAVGAAAVAASVAVPGDGLWMLPRLVVAAALLGLCLRTAMRFARPAVPLAPTAVPA